MKIDLSPNRKNFTSQCGEDGVIEALFKLFDITDGWLVEFGAWNGIHYSNTHYHAKKNQSFRQLLIECDADRFNELTQNVRWDERNVLLNLCVETEGENSLNEIFDRYIPKGEHIALLSIDIDGGDVDIFLSLDTIRYRPHIVIIEEGRWDRMEYLVSLVDAFASRGYVLAHVTGNFIFVDQSFGVHQSNGIEYLMVASGQPEYQHHTGLISAEEMMRRNTELHLNKFAEWALTQDIEIVK